MTATTTIPRQRTTGRKPAKRDAALPRPGLWVIDPSSAMVGFTGKASLLAPTVSARFAGVAGSVLVREDVAASEVDVEVDVTTMTSGHRAWDDLVSAVDPFGAGSYPTASYRSTSVRWHGDRADVAGHLVLRGVARSVPLTTRHTVSPCGERLHLAAEGKINREQFGVRFDVPGAGLIIPRDLTLAVTVEAVHAG
jgi:polyisoprenoid-binding protein YceI